MLLQAVLVVVIILMLLGKDRGLRKYFQKHGMTYGLLAGIVAVVGSLGFSLGYNYPPCDFCWYQRIFHYPNVILFAVAMKYHDARVWTYSIWLSVIGVIIGGYQVLIQFSPRLAESSFCNVVPAANSCSDILIQPFGYLSIPVMSVTLFTSMIVLYFLQKKKEA